MKKRIAVLLVVIVLLAVTTVTAFAESGTVVISGGELSLTAANVTLSPITLTGSAQTATSASTANEWTAVDSRGTGEGWNITIAATDFTSGGNTIAIDQAGSKFQIQILDTNITLNSGNDKPTSNVTGLTDIPKVTPLKIVSAAAGTGMGNYTIKPNYSLEVPSTVAAGTYTSTITVAIVAGP